METLILIIKELALIAAIIFLFYLIAAMIIAPIKTYRDKKAVEQMTNEFVSQLVDEIFKDVDKDKPKKVTKKQKND